MADSLQLDYDPAEDRLVLTFRRERSEIGSAAPELSPSLLLTRRVVAAWRPHLRVAAERSAAISPQLHPAARKVMTSAHHEVMASQAKKSSAPPVRVEPEQALLVRRVQTGTHKDGHWILRFDLRDGGGRALKLTSAMLHAFIAMLDRRIAQAGWGLPILADGANPLPAPSITKH